MSVIKLESTFRYTVTDCGFKARIYTPVLKDNAYELAHGAVLIPSIGWKAMQWDKRGMSVNGKPFSVKAEEVAP